jgi:putative ABC transport system substrate-binding protein
MLAGSVGVDAQRSPVKKVGVLWSGTADGTAPYWGSFIQGMKELGWIDGKTVRFIMRFDDDDKSKLPRLAGELVRLGVDVIAVTSVAARAASGATTTIPIVYLDASDPIVEGFTSSLRKPIGNVTGVSWQSMETGAKRVELAREINPQLKRLAVLYDPGDPIAVLDVEGYRKAVARTDLEFRTFEVRYSRDFPAAFVAIKKYRPEALMYPVSALSAPHVKQVVQFASALRLPTFTETAQYAEEGILLSYGIDFRSSYKLAAAQVDKILNGAKPENVPWEQPTSFELVVNLRTAKVLDLKIPDGIMLRTTRVIR